MELFFFLVQSEVKKYTVSVTGRDMKFIALVSFAALINICCVIGGEYQKIFYLKLFQTITINQANFDI